MDLAGVEAFAGLVDVAWAWPLPRGPQMHVGRIAAAELQQLLGVCSDLSGVQIHVHDKRSFFYPFGVLECFAVGVNRLRMHAISLRGPSYRDIFDGQPSLGMEPLDHTSQYLLPILQCLFTPVPESDGGRTWTARGRVVFGERNPARRHRSWRGERFWGRAGWTRIDADTGPRIISSMHSTSSPSNMADFPVQLSGCPSIPTIATKDIKD